MEYSLFRQSGFDEGGQTMVVGVGARRREGGSYYIIEILVMIVDYLLNSGGETGQARQGKTIVVSWSPSPTINYQYSHFLFISG